MKDCPSCENRQSCIRVCETCSDRLVCNTCGKKLCCGFQTTHQTVGHFIDGGIQCVACHYTRRSYDTNNDVTRTRNHSDNEGKAQAPCGTEGPKESEGARGAESRKKS